MRDAWLVVLAAVAAACKTEGVRSITLDLGVENGGSAGFACRESPSALCEAILDCGLRTVTREALTQCLADACRASSATRECLRITTCLRSDAATSADCYRAVCSAQPPLAARAAESDGGVHLHVEYVALGGTPGCRVESLRSWCAAHRCTVKRRRCLALTLPGDVLEDAEAAARTTAQAFASSRLLDDDALDEPVVVRITGEAKAGPCTPEEELPATLPPGRAIGCAYSCPVVLTAATGAVTVDLDLLGNVCTEAEVTSCRTLFDDDAGAP